MSPEWITVFLVALATVGGYCAWIDYHYTSKENTNNLAMQVKEVKDGLKDKFEKIDSKISVIKEQGLVNATNIDQYQKTIDKNQKTLESVDFLFSEIQLSRAQPPIAKKASGQ